MAVNQFDHIASLYDILGKVVFGTSIFNAQIVSLSHVKPNHNVLILGGGTGKLLENMPACEQIDFLELSEAMLKRAKNRKSVSPIHFIHANFLQYEFMEMYDVVICPFFLDCFSKDHLQEGVLKIQSVLKENGLLLVSDFQYKRRRWLISAMHSFFRVVANLESNELQDINHCILQAGFSLKKECFFSNEMIFSRVYRNL